MLVDESGETMNAGTQVNDTAESLVDKLQASSSVKSIFYQSAGGEFGALIATLLLIFISLLISLQLEFHCYLFT